MFFRNIVGADDVGLSSTWIDPFLEAVDGVEAIGLLNCAGWMRYDVAIGNEYVYINGGFEFREVGKRKCRESSGLAYAPEEKTQTEQRDLIHQAFKPIERPGCGGSS